MFHVVLVEPEIPPNTGNIIRLCANTGTQLHLIRPLGFDFEDKQLRRAGLDYHEFAQVQLYDHFSEFRLVVKPKATYGYSTKATKLYTEIDFQSDVALVFGSETRGLSDEIKHDIGANNLLLIPMQEKSRSLNLSNTAAIAVYEVWRQLGFTSSGD